MNRHRPPEDEIRLRAFEIYFARGCQPGHEVEDWLEAERELSQNVPAESPLPYPAAESPERR